MVSIKSDREIELMREACKLAANTHKLLEESIKPGISTYELDKMAEDYIRKNGGIPAQKNYPSGDKNIPNFPATICASVNDEVIHGIPSKKVILKDGDIVSIDLVALKNGFHGDCARTHIVGNAPEETKKLIQVTKQAFFEGIKFAKKGYRIGDISNAIYKYVSSNGYSVVREFQGHGIGRQMHEDPGIPNYGPAGKGIRIEPGMTLAIEPMVIMGKHDILELDEYLDKLKKSQDIVVKKKKYFLKEYYDYEEEIADSLEMISRHSKTRVTNFDDLIAAVQLEYDVKYNTDQKKAIKNALTNRISIITGGPGTGKTTIINSIVKLYVRIHNLNYKEVINDIALLAPTGRAAKKMSDSTGLPAMTIHRYLKWNKEKNEFQINEYNKNYHKLIIVDETSMIDTYLFASLLKGIGHNLTLVLVGDSNQLPSVGPGLILNDLIDSDMFTHTTLEQIYRQSDNSYIPILAKEIKEHDLSSEFTKQTDDYNFLHASGLTIKEMIRKICVMSKEKGLTEEEIQVLAPMYRGENGIDNLNVLLQDIFNPKSKDRKETKVGDITYRVGDKVLQLVNDPDNNIFNGDIGYISSIGTIMGSKNKDVFTINFDGNEIQYTREDLINIKHAYAITIHKSQGSEFAHVIMPVSKAYYKMLYNKLIYTGVSRAKKSLIIIGEEESLVMAVNNDYSNNRKTNLKEQIVNKFTPDEA